MALKVDDNIFVSKLDDLANWVRKHSLWPMPFATACCGIELMATASSRYDLARFGSEAMRFTPRQCDLMIVAGRVAMKMVPVMQRICCKCRNRSGASAWGRAPAPAGCSTPIPWCKGSTGSSRSMFMCPVAHHDRNK